MKNQTKKSGQWVPSLFLIIAGWTILMIFVVSDLLDMSWIKPRYQYEIPVIEHPKQITVEEFAARAAKNLGKRISLEQGEILKGSSERYAIAKPFPDYTTNSHFAFSLSRKYRMPSLKSRHLGISFSGDEVEYFEGDTIFFGKKDYHGNSYVHVPTYLVEIGKEQIVLDQNYNEMPKW